MRNLLRMFPKTAARPEPEREPDLPPRPSPAKPWGQHGVHDPALDPTGAPPISSKGER